MKNNVFKKGFTLIELMIVIVILGVLMGTILPRIAGVQSRSRDTGRMADLTSMSQALELYFDDFGEYPGTMGTVVCLAPAGTNFTFETSFKTYFKNEDVPTPPTGGEVTRFNGSDCTDGYVYFPLYRNGVSKAGYGIVANMEIAQKSNYGNGVVGDLASAIVYATDSDADSIVTELAKNTPDSMIDVEGEGTGAEKGKDTVFILVN